MSFQFEPGDAASSTPKSGRSAGEAASNGRNRTPVLIAWGILAVAAIAFIAQNAEQVAFQFLVFDFRWPLWVMLLMFFLLGLLSGLLVAWRRKGT